MNIRKDDYLDILASLTRKRWEGEELVGFPDDAFPINKEELLTFSTEEEARKFCNALATDLHAYNFLSIRSACRAMQEAAENNELLIEKNGLVDISRMVAVRYERLEKKQLDNNSFNKHQNTEVMNQKNFEYLKDQVKFTGFGDTLETELKQNLGKDQPDFKLQYETNFGKDAVNATLSFRRSKQSDMYFFNSYRVQLESQDKPEAMEQTFYINKGNNITLKEAYNLMEGRAVNKDLTNKEGQVYNAWIQMDFKQSGDDGNFKLKHFHQNYGYNLEEVLAKQPIKELDNEQYKSNLIDSLKKGNLQSATFRLDGEEQKRYIEASPQFKTLHVYDDNMQRIDRKQAKKEKQSEGEQQTAKQEQKKEKQEIEGDEPDVPKAKRAKRKTQKVS